MLIPIITLWIVGASLCIIGCVLAVKELCVVGSVISVIAALWLIYALWGSKCRAQLRVSSAPSPTKKVRFAVPEVTSTHTIGSERPRNGPSPASQLKVSPRTVSKYVTTKPFRPLLIQTGPATGAG